ncbi:hypothetical protein [Kingella oralis]|uniref:hypothetical protein n=1 Tax=Kingella oralis TaxID=505 RepID=UPI002D7E5F6C|nr:hypothetical protein [Kingella oralis]
MVFAWLDWFSGCLWGCGGRGLVYCKSALLLRQRVFQAALVRRVMRLTFSGCLIFHRQPETRLGDAKTVYAILR